VRAGGALTVAAGTGRVHLWNGREAHALGKNLLRGSSCGQWVLGAVVAGSRGDVTCGRCG